MRTIDAVFWGMCLFCLGLVFGCSGGDDPSGDVSSDDDTETVLEDTGTGEVDSDLLVDTDVDTATETSLEGEDIGFLWVPIVGTGVETYSMGNDASPLDEDKPAHEVTVPDFELTKTEITVTQYRLCMQTQDCTVPTGDLEHFSTNFLPFNANLPINFVTWGQADTFCKWAGGRLPTAAEWEYAARSGGMYLEYPWGTDPPSCTYAIMNEGFDGCGTTEDFPPRDVCSKNAGNTVFAELDPDQQLCDMIGNVYEYVQDCWHPNYTGAPNDGSAWVETPCTETMSTSDDERVVVRGGSYRHDDTHARATRQFGFSKVFGHRFYGFRCARDAQ